MSRVIVTGGRLSYPKLREMDEMSGKYQTSYIFDPGSQEELGMAIDEAVSAKWGADRPANLRMPIKDGNEKMDSRTGEVNPAYQGKYYFTAGTKFDPPGVITTDGANASDDLIYGGQNASLSVSVRAWEHPSGGKGVSIDLWDVRIDGGGEKFGGSSDGSANSDFGVPVTTDF